MLALGFLLLGGAFVATLLKALWDLISKDMEGKKFTGSSVISHFKWPLIFFVLFILFIVYGVPFLEGRS